MPFFSSVRNGPARFAEVFEDIYTQSIIVVPISLTTTMNVTFGSHLWSSHKLPPSLSPASVSAASFTDAQQQPHSILIPMGRCNFTSQSGVRCSCTSGSTTSELNMKERDEFCEDCGHRWSSYCAYGKNFTLHSNVFCLFIVPSTTPYVPSKSVTAPLHLEISPWTKTFETLARIREAKRVVHVRGTHFLRQNHSCTSPVTIFRKSRRVRSSNWRLAWYP